MRDFTVGNTVIVHKDGFAYISHPSIARTGERRWIAAFTHAPRRKVLAHPPNDPLFRTLLSRTSDDGRTWETPFFAPDFDW